MIETKEDMKKLFSLNIPIKHLVTTDLNASDRIFNEIVKRLTEMNYVIVHKSDLQQVPENADGNIVMIDI